MIRRALGVWLACAALGCSVLAAGDARACINAVEREVEIEVQLVTRAEAQLDRRQTSAAIRTLMAGHHGLRSRKPDGDGLHDRSLRLLAVAVVRLEGLLVGVKAFPSVTPAQRKANMAWALESLKAQLAERPLDTGLQCDYAEAVAGQPELAHLAVPILEDLEDRDLIITSQAYAALARLRRNPPTERPGFLAAPAAELTRLRADIDDVRSHRMRDRPVERRLTSPSMYVHGEGFYEDWWPEVHGRRVPPGYE